jgi:hypothetical protein
VPSLPGHAEAWRSRVMVGDARSDKPLRTMEPEQDPTTGTVGVLTPTCGLLKTHRFWR